MTPLRRSRWALSFADLCLLLLGFFVLLQAGAARREETVSQLSRYFSGRFREPVTEIEAASIFLSGEAMLTPHGERILFEISSQIIENEQVVEIQSRGEGKDGRRFDRWELSAARLAAVARAMGRHGVPEARIRILGLREDGHSANGQRILIQTKESDEKAR